MPNETTDPWYESAVNWPRVIFISQYAATKLNQERQAERDAELAAWIKEISDE